MSKEKKAMAEPEPKKIINNNRKIDMEPTIVNGKIVVRYVVGSPLGPVIEKVAEVLRSVDNIYERDNQLVRVQNGKIVRVNSHRKVQTAFKERGELLKIDDKHRYILLPSDLAGLILVDSAIISSFKNLRTVTRSPVYDTGLNLVQPGYNEHDGIYYHGPIVTPREGMAELEKIICDFPFRSGSDRTNFIAVFLTYLLIPNFREGHPGVVFNGNQPGVGKTLATQLVANLFEGHSVKSISCIAHQEEFEKNLGSIITDSNIVLIDNARPGKRAKFLIDSPVLERCLTDSQLSFRFIGTSNRIERPNDVLFFITVNNAQLNRDLATRCVPINFEWSGLAVDRTYSIPNLLKYVRAHRLEIIGELACLVEVWKSRGSPLSSKKTRFGLDNWSGVIGGILEANGIDGFLDNLEDSLKEFNPEENELAELAEDYVGVPMKPDAWLTIAITKKFLSSILTSSTRRGKQTQMGRFMKANVGRRVNMGMDGEGPEVVLESIDHGDRVEYVFEKVEGVGTVEVQAEVGDEVQAENPLPDNQLGAATEPAEPPGP